MKKYIIFLLLVGSLFALTTSCEDMFGDYLDKGPGVDVTEDTIFSSKAQAELFLAATYEQALYSPFWDTKYKNGSQWINNEIYDVMPNWSCFTDEGEHQAPWYPSNSVNSGTLNKAGKNFYDWGYSFRWTAVRMVHTLLERIDDVPDADGAYKTQIKAQARYMRAELNFDMFRRYGGISIVDRRFAPKEVEEMKVKRSSVDSTVQFIVQDLDFAIANLPDVYPSNFRGKITKGAALGLKSRTLLFAASPQFNTATPVLNMENPADNRMICYGNFDKNRWQKAADAAKAVIDWAPSGGIHLITDKGVDKNYRFVWEQPDNAEIILANKQSNGVIKQNPFFLYWLCSQVGGQKGVQPTQNFIERYYDKRDGTPQDWPEAANNLSDKYAELDYRFPQTIGYNGSYWNKNRGNLAMYLAPPAPAGAHSGANITGYFVKKFIPDAANSTWGPQFVFNYPRQRLAEFYLNYAEALNEAQGPVAAAYEAVNAIRARSGMPPLPAGLSQDEFRKRIRKERGIEMAFEGHHFWDIRRWLAGEELCSGPFYGLKIYKNLPVTNPLTFRYEKYVFEQRVWQSKFYLNYHTTDQINLGYVVQNPGW